MLVDLIAFVLGFYVAWVFRRSLDISLRFQDRVLTYGAVAVASFLVVEILTEDLKGIVARGLVKESQVVVTQMTMTWTVYISTLFFMHNIYMLSRIFAFITYLVCTLFLLLFRCLWKAACKFSKASDSVMPEMLIVCEAAMAQTVLNRMVSGALSKQYEICGIVTNEKGDLDYHDWYPHETGLNQIDSFIGQRRVQYAYVELKDRREEKKVIDRLLNAGIVVYRSLGDSILQYADQSIDQLDGKSVITISGAQVSLASKAERILQRLRRKILRAREKRT